MPETWQPVWGERTYIMGVLNVTPDSFSGDGMYRQPEAALARGLQLVEEGADILDIGGESTRPGHVAVSLDEELERVLPVIALLSQGVSVPLSIDTRKPEVARQALRAGASVVNDTSGLKDGELAVAAAEIGASLVITDHFSRSAGVDVIGGIILSLTAAIERAEGLGVMRDRIMLDPGLGFGKGRRENFEILRRLPELGSLGLPLILGASRKGMIGRVLGTDPSDRLEGSLALAAIGIAGGAEVLRVHDVLATVRVARMMDAIVR